MRRSRKKEEAEVQTVLICTPHLLNEGDTAQVQSNQTTQTIATASPLLPDEAFYNQLQRIDAGEILRDSVQIFKLKKRLAFSDETMIRSSIYSFHTWVGTSVTHVPPKENHLHAETQTRLMVFPHILRHHERAVVTCDVNLQTDVTCEPQSSLSEIVPQLRAYFEHTGREVRAGDSVSNKSILDIIKEILNNVDRAHDNLFDDTESLLDGSSDSFFSETRSGRRSTGSDPTKDGNEKVIKLTNPEITTTEKKVRVTEDIPPVKNKIACQTCGDSVSEIAKCFTDCKYPEIKCTYDNPFAFDQCVPCRETPETTIDRDSPEINIETESGAGAPLDQHAETETVMKQSADGGYEAQISQTDTTHIETAEGDEIVVETETRYTMSAGCNQPKEKKFEECELKACEHCLCQGLKINLCIKNFGLTSAEDPNKINLDLNLLPGFEKLEVKEIIKPEQPVPEPDSCPKDCCPSKLHKNTCPSMLKRMGDGNSVYFVEEDQNCFCDTPNCPCNENGLQEDAEIQPVELCEKNMVRKQVSTDILDCRAMSISNILDGAIMTLVSRNKTGFDVVININSPKLYGNQEGKQEDKGPECTCEKFDTISPIEEKRKCFCDSIKCACSTPEISSLSTTEKKCICGLIKCTCSSPEINCTNISPTETTKCPCSSPDCACTDFEVPIKPADTTEDKICPINIEVVTPVPLEANVKCPCGTPGCKCGMYETKTESFFAESEPLAPIENKICSCGNEDCRCDFNTTITSKSEPLTAVKNSKMCSCGTEGCRCHLNKTITPISEPKISSNNLKCICSAPDVKSSKVISLYESTKSENLISTQNPARVSFQQDTKCDNCNLPKCSCTAEKTPFEQDASCSCGKRECACKLTKISNEKAKCKCGHPGCTCKVIKPSTSLPNTAKSKKLTPNQNLPARVTFDQNVKCNCGHPGCTCKFVKPSKITSLPNTAKSENLMAKQNPPSAKCNCGHPGCTCKVAKPSKITSLPDTAKSQNLTNQNVPQKVSSVPYANCNCGVCACKTGKSLTSSTKSAVKELDTIVDTLIKSDRKIVGNKEIMNKLDTCLDKCNAICNSMMHKSSGKKYAAKPDKQPETHNIPTAHAVPNEDILIVITPPTQQPEENVKQERISRCKTCDQYKCAGSCHKNKMGDNAAVQNPPYPTRIPEAYPPSPPSPERIPSHYPSGPPSPTHPSCTCAKRAENVPTRIPSQYPPDPPSPSQIPAQYPAEPPEPALSIRIPTQNPPEPPLPTQNLSQYPPDPPSPSQIPAQYLAEPPEPRLPTRNLSQYPPDPPSPSQIPAQYPSEPTCPARCAKTPSNVPQPPLPVRIPTQNPPGPPSPTRIPAQYPPDPPSPSHIPVQYPAEPPLPTRNLSEYPPDPPSPSQIPVQYPAEPPLPTRNLSQYPPDHPSRSQIPAQYPAEPTCPARCAKTPSNVPQPPLPVRIPTQNPPDPPSPTQIPSQYPSGAPLPIQIPAQYPAEPPLPTRNLSEYPPDPPSPSQIPAQYPAEPTCPAKCAKTPSNVPQPNLPVRIPTQNPPGPPSPTRIPAQYPPDPPSPSQIPAQYPAEPTSPSDVPQPPLPVRIPTQNPPEPPLPTRNLSQYPPDPPSPSHIPAQYPAEPPEPVLSIRIPTQNPPDPPLPTRNLSQYPPDPHSPAQIPAQSPAEPTCPARCAKTPSNVPEPALPVRIPTQNPPHPPSPTQIPSQYPSDAPLPIQIPAQYPAEPTCPARCAKSPSDVPQPPLIVRIPTQNHPNLPLLTQIPSQYPPDPSLPSNISAQYPADSIDPARSEKSPANVPDSSLPVRILSQNTLGSPLPTQNPAQYSPDSLLPVNIPSQNPPDPSFSARIPYENSPEPPLPGQSLPAYLLAPCSAPCAKTPDSTSPTSRGYSATPSPMTDSSFTPSPVTGSSFTPSPVADSPFAPLPVPNSSLHEGRPPWCTCAKTPDPSMSTSREYSTTPSPVADPPVPTRMPEYLLLPPPPPKFPRTPGDVPDPPSPKRITPEYSHQVTFDYSTDPSEIPQPRKEFPEYLLRPSSPAGSPDSTVKSWEYSTTPDPRDAWSCSTIPSPLPDTFSSSGEDSSSCPAPCAKTPADVPEPPSPERITSQNPPDPPLPTEIPPDSICRARCNTSPANIPDSSLPVRILSQNTPDTPLPTQNAAQYSPDAPCPISPCPAKISAGVSDPPLPVRIPSQDPPEAPLPTQNLPAYLLQPCSAPCAKTPDSTSPTSRGYSATPSPMTDSSFTPSPVTGSSFTPSPVADSPFAPLPVPNSSLHEGRPPWCTCAKTPDPSMSTSREYSTTPSPVADPPVPTRMPEYLLLPPPPPKFPRTPGDVPDPPSPKRITPEYSHQVTFDYSTDPSEIPQPRKEFPEYLLRPSSPAGSPDSTVKSWEYSTTPDPRDAWSCSTIPSPLPDTFSSSGEDSSSCPAPCAKTTADVPEPPSPERITSQNPPDPPLPTEIPPDSICRARCNTSPANVPDSSLPVRILSQNTPDTPLPTQNAAQYSPDAPCPISPCSARSAKISAGVSDPPLPVRIPSQDPPEAPLPTQNLPAYLLAPCSAPCAKTPDSCSPTSRGYSATPSPMTDSSFTPSPVADSPFAPLPVPNSSLHERRPPWCTCAKTPDPSMSTSREYSTTPSPVADPPVPTRMPEYLLLPPPPPKFPRTPGDVPDPPSPKRITPEYSPQVTFDYSTDPSAVPPPRKEFPEYLLRPSSPAGTPDSTVKSWEYSTTPDPRDAWSCSTIPSPLPDTFSSSGEDSSSCPAPCAKTPADVPEPPSPERITSQNPPDPPLPTEIPPDSICRARCNTSPENVPDSSLPVRILSQNTPDTPLPTQNAAQYSPDAPCPISPCPAKISAGVSDPPLPVRIPSQDPPEAPLPTQNLPAYLLQPCSAPCAKTPDTSSPTSRGYSATPSPMTDSSFTPSPVTHSSFTPSPVADSSFAPLPVPNTSLHDRKLPEFMLDASCSAPCATTPDPSLSSSREYSATPSPVADPPVPTRMPEYLLVPPPPPKFPRTPGDVPDPPSPKRTTPEYSPRVTFEYSTTPSDVPYPRKEFPEYLLQPSTPPGTPDSVKSFEYSTTPDPRCAWSCSTIPSPLPDSFPSSGEDSSPCPAPCANISGRPLAVRFPAENPPDPPLLTGIPSHAPPDPPPPIRGHSDCLIKCPDSPPAAGNHPLPVREPSQPPIGPSESVRGPKKCIPNPPSPTRVPESHPPDPPQPSGFPVLDEDPAEPPRLIEIPGFAEAYLPKEEGRHRSSDRTRRSRRDSDVEETIVPSSGAPLASAPPIQSMPKFTPHENTKIPSAHTMFRLPDNKVINVRVTLDMLGSEYTAPNKIESGVTKSKQTHHVVDDTISSFSVGVPPFRTERVFDVNRLEEKESLASSGYLKEVNPFLYSESSKTINILTPSMTSGSSGESIRPENIPDYSKKVEKSITFKSSEIIRIVSGAGLEESIYVVSQSVPIEEKCICKPCPTIKATKSKESMKSKKSAQELENRDVVYMAFKTCEMELKPALDALTNIKQELQKLNMPEVDCIFKQTELYREVRPNRVKERIKELSKNDSRESQVRKMCQPKIEIEIRNTPSRPKVMPSNKTTKCRYKNPDFSDSDSKVIPNKTYSSSSKSTQNTSSIRFSDKTSRSQSQISKKVCCPKIVYSSPKEYTKSVCHRIQNSKSTSTYKTKSKPKMSQYDSAYTSYPTLSKQSVPCSSNYKEKSLQKKQSEQYASSESEKSVSKVSSRVSSEEFVCPTRHTCRKKGKKRKHSSGCSCSSSGCPFLEAMKSVMFTGQFIGSKPRRKDRRH